MEIRKGRLNDHWLGQLERRRKVFFSDMDDWSLIDHWMINDWNSGTGTLCGVYQNGQTFVQLCFPDYERPKKEEVQPVFEHTGWKPS